MESLPVLVTWGFHPTTGKLELDSFLELDDPKNAPSVQLVYLRTTYTHYQVSLLHIPEDWGRERVAEWMSVEEKDVVVAKLKEAKVRIEEVVRKKNNVNSIDFILGD